jgi:hypothetical protein
MLRQAACFTCYFIAFAQSHAGEDFRWEFDFSQSDHGFVAGFADLPADYDPPFYALISDHTDLPPELGEGKALFISGDNHSDDLWMHFQKKLTGLRPDTEYELAIEVELASKYATGLLGVGGAPGDSVYFKSGASTTEPTQIVDNEEWLRLSVDKGNQFQSGADLARRGTIAKPDDGNENYVMLTRHNHGDPQIATTASDGSLWLVFGTDSGFESVTALYYTKVTVWANMVDHPHLWMESGDSPDSVSLVWNQGSLETSTNLDTWELVMPNDRPVTYQIPNDMSRVWRIVKE